MGGRAKTRSAEPQAAVSLEILDHVLGEMLVLANEDMDVVGHDRAGVARVALICDHFTEGGRDHGAGKVVEGQQRVAKQVTGPLIELAHFTSGGLESLPAEVQLAEIG